MTASGNDATYGGETAGRADGDYNYAEVGATRALALPPGYEHLRRTGAAGRGMDDFRAAAEALMCWDVHRRAGLTVHSAPGPARTGTRVVRLAVAAVNPRGGENGAFGDEEIEHIAPAVRAVCGGGEEVHGPVPADSVFHQLLEGRFDGVLSQYHDQGHIAAKTFDFDGTVSVTVGLPILRTSVDHGTAFDIAGRGIANPGTMRSAFLHGADFARFADRIRAEYGG